MLKKNVGATMLHGGLVVAFTAEAIAEVSKRGVAGKKAAQGLSLNGDREFSGQGSAKRCTGDPKRLRKMTIG